MNRRIRGLIWSWLIRTLLYFFPDAPLVMRVRGYLYSIMMPGKFHNFQVAHNVILNNLENIFLGDNIYMAPGIILLAGGKITIGDNTLIAPLTVMCSSNHVYDGKSYRNSSVQGDISIGSGCWIGSQCTILKDTYIHNNTVIGASSLCNKDLEIGNALYCGSPVKFIKNC